VSSFLRRLPWRKTDLQPAHLRTGEWGEGEAEKFLKRSGYRILGRRVVVGVRDELDLVARSPNDVLVFIEVKTRSNEAFGRPGEAIDQRKQKALSRAAWKFIKRLKPHPEYFRFDVVEVVGSMDEGHPKIRHIENAFSLLGKKRIGW